MKPPPKEDEEPGGLNFGPAGPADVEALVSIDALSLTPWTAEAFLAELHHRPSTLFVRRSCGAAVAFAVVRVQVPEMDIVNVAVGREHRRRGFARGLLREVFSHVARLGVRTVFLEVREGNQAARNLYGSLGFEQTQIRRGFYKDPVEDAVLMRSQIAS